MGYIKERGRFNLGLLTCKTIPKTIRVLLCLMQGPEHCWWSSIKVGVMTGMSDTEVRVYWGRLVKAGLLKDMKKEGGRGFKVTIPNATKECLEMLSSLSGDTYVNDDVSKHARIKQTSGKLKGLKDWDLIPYQENSSIERLLPFAHKPDTKEFIDFWAAVQKRVRAVMRRTKTNLPACIVTAAITAWTFDYLVKHGYPKKVNSPVAFAISRMKKFPHEILRNKRYMFPILGIFRKGAGLPALQSQLKRNAGNAVVPHLNELKFSLDDHWKDASSADDSPGEDKHEASTEAHHIHQENDTTVNSRDSLEGNVGCEHQVNITPRSLSDRSGGCRVMSIGLRQCSTHETPELTGRAAILDFVKPWD
ncbi:MAG: hypothetical protein ISR64_10575 [Deltaproteobacteria bacterium]|nr:hypothetical protein [Deltaproteobacteria bacterium]